MGFLGKLVKAMFYIVKMWNFWLIFLRAKKTLTVMKRKGIKRPFSVFVLQKYLWRRKMLERQFQAELIKEIKERFKGCIVIKNDSSYMQGIPDLMILYKNKMGGS